MADGEGVDWRVASGVRPASVTAVDIDGDGRLDVFVAGRRGGREPGVEATSNLLLLQTSDGDFSAAPDHPLSSIDAVNAALWGDVDNDGLVDVFLCRTAGNALWRQSERGVWEDVTASALPAGPALDTVDGAIFDADHDGDLDVFCVNGDGPDRLLSNNLDGTFRDIAPDSGLDGGDRPSRHGSRRDRRPPTPGTRARGRTGRPRDWTTSSPRKGSSRRVWPTPTRTDGRRSARSRRAGSSSSGQRDRTADGALARSFRRRRPATAPSCRPLISTAT